MYPDLVDAFERLIQILKLDESEAFAADVPKIALMHGSISGRAVAHHDNSPYGKHWRSG